MRGVCALNIEAMNLFKKESDIPNDNVLPSQKNPDLSKHPDTTESLSNPIISSSSIHQSSLPSSTKVTISSPPTILKTTTDISSSANNSHYPSSDATTRFEPQKPLPLPARHPLRRSRHPR